MGELLQSLNFRRLKIRRISTGAPHELYSRVLQVTCIDWRKALRILKQEGVV